MYGHAAGTYTTCTTCPQYAPRWATTITADGSLMCARCARLALAEEAS